MDGSGYDGLLWVTRGLVAAKRYGLWAHKVYGLREVWIKWGLTVSLSFTALSERNCVKKVASQLEEIEEWHISNLAKLAFLLQSSPLSQLSKIHCLILHTYVWNTFSFHSESGSYRSKDTPTTWLPCLQLQDIPPNRSICCPVALNCALYRHHLC